MLYTMIEFLKKSAAADVQRTTVVSGSR